MDGDIKAAGTYTGAINLFSKEDKSFAPFVSIRQIGKSVFIGLTPKERGATMRKIVVIFASLLFTTLILSVRRAQLTGTLSMQSLRPRGIVHVQNYGDHLLQNSQWV